MRAAFCTVHVDLQHPCEVPQLWRSQIRRQRHSPSQGTRLRRLAQRLFKSIRRCPLEREAFAVQFIEMRMFMLLSAEVRQTQSCESEVEARSTPILHLIFDLDASSSTARRVSPLQSNGNIERQWQAASGTVESGRLEWHSDQTSTLTHAT